MKEGEGYFEQRGLPLPIDQAALKADPAYGPIVQAMWVTRRM